MVEKQFYYLKPIDTVISKHHIEARVKIHEHLRQDLIVEVFNGSMVLKAMLKRSIFEITVWISFLRLEISYIYFYSINCICLIYFNN